MSKTDCPMDENGISECIIYKASVTTATNKYYYGTMKTLPNNIAITIHVLLEISLVKSTQNCLSMYGY